MTIVIKTKEGFRRVDNRDILFQKKRRIILLEKTTIREFNRLREMNGHTPLHENGAGHAKIIRPLKYREYYNILLEAKEDPAVHLINIYDGSGRAIVVPRPHLFGIDLEGLAERAEGKIMGVRVKVNRRVNGSCEVSYDDIFFKRRGYDVVGFAATISRTQLNHYRWKRKPPKGHEIYNAILNNKLLV